MRIYKNDSDMVDISYDDPSTLNQSTTFLITVRPEGYRYSYLVPYAESEEDAVSKFMVSVQRLIIFCDLRFTEEQSKEEEFLVERDIFDLKLIERKLETLKKQREKIKRKIAKVDQRIKQAVIEDNKSLAVKWSLFRQRLISQENQLCETIEIVRKSEQQKTVKDSIRNICLRKQFEILKAHEQGKVTAERLPAHRVIPVSYFDDSRGEIGYAASNYALPVERELPSWVRDVVE